MFNCKNNYDTQHIGSPHLNKYAISIKQLYKDIDKIHYKKD